MNFKAIALVAALLSQPLAFGLTAGSAFAASTGGGGGGNGPSGNGEGGNVMQSGTCLAWNYQRAEEAVRLQKEICPKKVSATSAPARVQ